MIRVKKEKNRQGSILILKSIKSVLENHILNTLTLKSSATVSSYLTI